MGFDNPMVLIAPKDGSEQLLDDRAASIRDDQGKVKVGICHGPFQGFCGSAN
jgi:hypothetical protein